ncbi:MAG: MarR family transcriptional regulator [Cyclobacteriaceae bacterium]
MESDKTIFPFEKPEDDTGFLLWQVTMRWQRRMKQGLDSIGLTHTQFVLMAATQWLLNIQEDVNQIEVAHRAQVDKMMTSKVFKTLVGKQLVRMRASTEDKRAKLVMLTPQGRKVLQSALSIAESIDAEFFSLLKGQEAEFQRMMQLLMREG